MPTNSKLIRASISAQEAYLDNMMNPIEIIKIIISFVNWTMSEEMINHSKFHEGHEDEYSAG